MHGHQGTVRDLLYNVAVVSECIADHDVVVPQEDLGIAILRWDAILHNDEDLVECPGHSLTQLVLGFNGDGRPNVLSLPGKVKAAGGVSHFAGGYIKEAAQRRVIGNLAGATAHQHIGAVNIESGAIVLGDFGGSKAGREILEIFVVAKATNVVKLGVVDFPAEDRMVQFEIHAHAGHGVGSSRQRMFARKN